PPAGGPQPTPGSADRDRRSLAIRRKVPPPSVLRTQPAPADVAPGAPAPMSRGEWEPVPAPGPNPLAMWQQQMQLMETFHNDMIMMVQMFIAMHREHLAAVRGELDHVQKLTRELTRLNARLGRLPESAEATPAVGTGGGDGSPRRERRPAPQAGR